MSYTFHPKKIEHDSETDTLLPERKEEKSKFSLIQKKLNVRLYGEAGTGKTTLIKTFLGNNYKAGATPTKQLKILLERDKLELDLEFEVIEQNITKPSQTFKFQEGTKKKKKEKDNTEPKEQPDFKRVPIIENQDKREIIDVVVALVDLSKPYSKSEIRAIKEWKKKLAKDCGTTTLIFLVGTKSDLQPTYKHQKDLHDLLNQQVNNTDKMSVEALFHLIGETNNAATHMADKISSAGF